MSDKAKEALHNLEPFLAAADERLLGLFCRYLADHVNERMNPREFVAVYAQVLMDLQLGIRMSDDVQLVGPLVRQAPEVYSGLEKHIGELAGAAFDDDFAAAVRSLMGM